MSPFPFLNSTICMPAAKYKIWMVAPTIPLVPVMLTLILKVSSNTLYVAFIVCSSSTSRFMISDGGFPELNVVILFTSLFLSTNKGDKSNPRLIVISSKAFTASGLAPPTASSGTGGWTAFSSTISSVASKAASMSASDTKTGASGLRLSRRSSERPTQNHSSCFISASEHRFEGEGTRSFCKRAFAPTENQGGKVYSAFIIFRKRVDIFGSSKGRNPANKT
mmetsp:Transcript_46292/g.75559  ORF Transcript_46292/g.75559 Transcript_46292/m.75559 type:complete len:222 (+) Transcript_46292:140-805(+)